LVAPVRRRVPWLLLAIDLVMVIGGILFLRAGIAVSDGEPAGDGGAGSGSGPGSGSATSIAPPPEPAPSPLAIGSGSGSGSAMLGTMPTPVVTTGPTLGGGGGGGGGGGRGVGGGGLLGGGGATRPPDPGTGTGSGSGSGSGTAAPPVVTTPDASPFSQPPVDAKPDKPDPPDPPKPVSLNDEIDRIAAKSESKFDRCKSQASESRPADRPLQGDIDIAFQITGTGDVKNAAIVNDTTDAPDLGPCLLAVIQSWQFSSTGKPTADFHRAFRYRPR
jgi:hypothetical protein